MGLHPARRKGMRRKAKRPIILVFIGDAFAACAHRAIERTLCWPGYARSCISYVLDHHTFRVLDASLVDKASEACRLLSATTKANRSDTARCLRVISNPLAGCFARIFRAVAKAHSGYFSSLLMYLDRFYAAKINSVFKVPEKSVLSMRSK